MPTYIPKSGCESHLLLPPVLLFSLFIHCTVVSNPLVWTSQLSPQQCLSKERVTADQEYSAWKATTTRTHSFGRKILAKWIKLEN